MAVRRTAVPVAAVDDHPGTITPEGAYTVHVDQPINGDSTTADGRRAR